MPNIASEPLYYQRLLNWRNPLTRGLKAAYIVLPRWRNSLTWRDLVSTSGGGPGNNGTLTNGTTWSGEAPPGGYGSLSFNGSTAYVRITDSTALHFTFSDFTILAWVKRAVTGAYHTIVDHRDSSAIGYLLGIRSDNNKLDCFVKDTATHSAEAQSSSTITDTNWHRVVATVERGGSITLYIDGKPDGTPVSVASVTGSIATTNDLAIGSRSPGISSSWTFFQGSIDNVLLLSRALSASEIAADYTEGYRRLLNRLPRFKESPQVATASGGPFPWYLDNPLCGGFWNGGF